MTSSIPAYRGDALYATVSEERLERLQSAGLVARVVRSRKGDIKRVILFGRPGDPTPTRAYLGTRYSFKVHLDNGSQCWRLKQLDHGGHAKASFLRVIEDCLSP